MHWKVPGAKVPRFDVTALGESMLRLSVPSGERLSLMRELDVHLGGTETNTCASLASLGRRCGWLSALPTHDLGDYVLSELRRANINTDAVVRTKGRVGIYFVEFANTPRPINVVYDRADSAVTKLTSPDIDWGYLLDTRVLHLTGITPALSEQCYELTLEAAQNARHKGVTVSFDVNYRGKLWSPEAAKAGLEPILQHVDLLICGQGDAETVFGFTGDSEAVLKDLHALSPAKNIVLTRSAEGAATFIEGELLEVKAKTADVVDRIGAGDAFTAGVIDGFLDGDLAQGLRRGALLSALALVQRGDMVTTSRDELNNLLDARNSSVNR